jgi:hypothetical protein
MTTYVHKHEVEAIQVPFDIIIVRPKANGRKEERLPCPAMGYLVRKGEKLIALTKEQFEKEYLPKKSPPKTVTLTVGEWTPIDTEEEEAPSD